MNRSRPDRSLTRRDLLKAGLAAGAAASAGSLVRPAPAGAQVKRGGILRVRGYDPPTFDPHLTLNFKTNTTLSFVYSKLVRHKVGPTVSIGTYAVEPDLAERWEEPDDLTVVFYLRKGVKWQNKPPVNGREFTAEDVKFTYDRFLTEKGNPLKFMLDPVDRVEVVDRYTVRFRLKEPFVWLLHVLALPVGMWIVPREVVDKHGDLKRAGDRHRHRSLRPGPLRAEREDGVQAEPGLLPARSARGGRRGVDGDGGRGRAVSPRTARGRWTAALALVGGAPAGPGGAPEEPFPARCTRTSSSPVTTGIYMRTDKPPFNDVRVRRAISHAVNRQATIDAVFLKGEPSPAISRGVPEWSPRIDQLGPGAQYYRHDPKEARRLLAEAGFPQGLKTTLTVTPGYGSDAVDAFQLTQRQLKEARHRRGAEAAGVRRLHLDHVPRQVRRHGHGPVQRGVGAPQRALRHVHAGELAQQQPRQRQQDDRAS